MTQQICTGCGNPVEEKTACGQCGTVQGAPVPASPQTSTPAAPGETCNACGNPVAMGQEKCGACGAPIGQLLNPEQKTEPSAADLDAATEEQKAAEQTEQREQPFEVLEPPEQAVAKALVVMGYDEVEAAQLATAAQAQIEARKRV
jgi:hypothetical protein